MVLWGFLGGLGQGKTLCATIWALYFANKGFDVYSNYRIEGVKTIDGKAFIELSKPSPDKKRIMVIDEVYAWMLDSRMSMRKVQTYFTYLITQSRKRGNDILYTSQLAGAVDLRLRDLSECFTYCRKYKDHFEFIYTNRIKMVIKNTPMSVAKEYFPKYDTYEIVPVPNVRLEDLGIVSGGFIEDRPKRAK